MNNNQHFIDQRGVIVTTTKIGGKSCKGCCYFRADEHCRNLVPAEHLVGTDDLYCITEEMVTYREVK